MATPEDNKATIRRYVEVLNQQDLAGLHEVFSANYRLEFAGMPDPMNSRIRTIRSTGYLFSTKGRFTAGDRSALDGDD